jgi:hypothetical protein
MSVLAIVERKAIFRLTRVLALIVIILLALGTAFAIYSAVVGTTAVPSGKVKAEDVFKDKAGATAAAEGGHAGSLAQDPLASLKIPEVATLKTWLTIPENKNVINAKLVGTELADRQEYLDGIGKVITMAENQKRNPAESVGRYFGQIEQARAAKAAAEIERKAEREKAIYAIGIGLGLIALFSLVLVLLAIERNTRTNPVVA